MGVSLTFIFVLIVSTFCFQNKYVGLCVLLKICIDFYGIPLCVCMGRWVGSVVWLHACMGG